MQPDESHKDRIIRALTSNGQANAVDLIQSVSANGGKITIKTADKSDAKKLLEAMDTLELPSLAIDNDDSTALGINEEHLIQLEQTRNPPARFIIPSEPPKSNDTKLAPNRA